MSVKLHDAVCFDSLQYRLFYLDDFHGDQLQDEWRETGDAGGTIAVTDAQTGGIVRITTDTDDDDEWYMDWGDIRSLLTSKNVSIEVRAKIATVTTVQAVIGLFDDANDLVQFVLDTDTDGNWYIETMGGGTSVPVDTGITADTSYHIYRIECTADEVKFFIDDVQTTGSPETSNISTVALQPYLFIHTRADAARTMDIDYICIRQNR